MRPNLGSSKFGVPSPGTGHYEHQHNLNPEGIRDLIRYPKEYTGPKDVERGNVQANCGWVASDHGYRRKLQRVAHRGITQFLET